MKILQLCKKFPYPPKDGESIAVTYLSKAMAEQGCEITLLSLNTNKHFINLEELPTSFNHYRQVHTVQLDNAIKRWDAFKNLFSKKSYHISRFESEAYEAKLVALLKAEEFDIVQLETLYLAPYLDVIRKHSKALVVMRAHNVEHEIWERLQENIDFLPKRWYLKYLTSKLKKFEVQTLENYDFLVPISEVDLGKFRRMGYSNGARAIPIGLDLDGYAPTPIKIDRPLTMGFIGSLDWMPNLEGVKWFLDSIWPTLTREFTDLELHIAGRHAPEDLLSASQGNLIVHGEVNCAKDFLNRHQIMVVPLLSGSGIRAKIIEAMALGRIVITTSLGLEGIPAKDRKHVYVADTVDEFMEVLTLLHKTPQKLAETSRLAQEFVHANYSHTTLAKDLAETLVAYREKQAHKKVIAASTKGNRESIKA